MQLGSNISRIIVVMLALLWGGGQVRAQVSFLADVHDGKELIFRTWGQEEGLPVNSLSNLVFGQDGFLYIATYAGLVRFDGANFTTFDSGNTPVFESDRFIYLYALPDSSILVADEVGNWYRFGYSSTQKMMFPDGDPPIHHSKVLQGENGTVWASSSTTLFKLNKDGFHVIFKTDDSRILAAGMIDENEFWVLVQEGLGRLTPSSGFELMIHAHELPYDINETGLFDSMIQLFRSHDREIVALYRGKDIVLLDRQGQILFSYRLHHETAYIRRMLPYEDHSLILSTYGGYYLLNYVDLSISTVPMHVESFGSNTTYPTIWHGKPLIITTNTIYWDNQVVYRSESEEFFMYAATDDNMGIWLVTNGNGLMHIRKPFFGSLGKSKGLPGENVYGIAEGESGSLWLATQDAGILHLSPEGKVHYPSPILGRSVTRLQSGSVWAGYWGGDAYEVVSHESRLRFIDPYDPESPIEKSIQNSVDAIFEDSGGAIWMGKRHELLRKNDKNSPFRTVLLNDGQMLPTVRVITELPNGALLMGTLNQGMFLWKDDSITPVFAGLSETQRVRDIRVDEDIIWLTTEGYGLVRLRLNTDFSIAEISTVTSRDGLKDNTLHRILSDEKGFFWLSSNNGLYRVKKAEVNRYLDDDLSILPLERYSVNDGLPTNEFNGGVLHAGLRLQNGLLTFPSQKGVVFFDPASFPEEHRYNRAAIYVEYRIQGAEDFQPIMNNRVYLKADERFLQLRAGVRYFDDQSGIHIQYQLGTSEWQNLGVSREITLDALSSGTLNIHFRIANAPESKVNTYPLLVDIAPFFYETHWFKLLLLFGVLGGFGVVIQVIRRNAHLREQKLSKLVQQRTEDLEAQKHRAEQALKAVELQAVELEAGNRYKQDVFLGLTHEFQTPLTLIMGAADILDDTAPSTYKRFAERHIRSIRENSDRLRQLSARLLQSLGNSSSSGTLNMEKVTKEDLIHSVAESYRKLAHDRGITLEVVHECEPGYISMDITAFELIVGNLLSNACKYSYSGSVIKVHSRDHMDGSFWEIIVEDNGPGIEQVDIDKIFQAYFRSEANISTPGTGIGLSVAKRMIQMLNGTIEVTSDPGNGTEFRVLLPVLRELEKPAIAAPGLTYDPKPFVDASKPVLLFVDDHKEMFELATDTFHGMYNLIYAANGVEGLEQIDRIIPDIIISDIMMPKMNGIQFARKVREKEHLSRIPFVFLSVRNELHSVEDGLTAGAEIYLPKPVTMSMLRSQVHALLFRQKSRTVGDVGKKKELVRRVDDLVLTHLADPALTVERIASTLSMSRPTLYRKWRACTSQPLTDYIIDLRLEEAIKLMHEGELNLTQVALACGFNSLSYFSRVFKAKKGVAPNKFEV